ncbi:LptA/OstA family protein [Microbaculum marinum]|uniref:LptA/OstA family protein n=1 Tax=Microbaculum marinum TaxID=1764581 RepID=A0AAW9RNW5_9HYPH
MRIELFRLLSRLAIPVAVAALSIAPVPAAQAQAVSDAFSNLSVESDKPVKIEADQLEVFDDQKAAVFSGNVIVRQGNTTMRTSELKVYYQGEGAATEDATGQRVSKLEATGEVVVIAEGQKATGDWAVFEMATQEVRLGGKVVLTQGQNVLRGTELVVNLETGQSKLVSAEQTTGGTGRVQGLFIPGAMGQKQEKSQDRDAPADQTN